MRKQWNGLIGLLPVVLVACLAATSARAFEVLERFTVGESRYYLVAGSEDGLTGITWTDAEAFAVALGGHLVTINSQAEQDLIWNRWGTSSRPAWPPGNHASLLIGLADETGSGGYEWSSGEAVAYTNWGPNEPSGDGGYVFMAGALFAGGDESRGKWNDYYDVASHSAPGQLLYGVVEVEITTTIDAWDCLAWGENIGWTNWRWDTGLPGGGATVGRSYCSGYIYGENVGWIQLGTGVPANGIQYGNDDAIDYGVNHDGAGGLSGLAWGENVGWVRFDRDGSAPPRIDYSTGRLSGYVYGENIGWIDLGSGGTNFVRTTSLASGPDADFDMIADAWELEQAANAGLGADLNHLSHAADADHDGWSDYKEYVADSDPFDSTDQLRIFAFDVVFEAQPGINLVTLGWSSSPRRLYDVWSSVDLTSFDRRASDVPPDSGTTTTLDFTDGSASRNFWRVGAKLPLAP